MTSLTKGHFRTKLIRVFFIFLKEFSNCFSEFYICYRQVYIQKHRFWIQVKILDQSNTGEFSFKIYTSFFFFLFFLMTCICFFNALMCCLQVFMHTRRHLIEVKILDQSTRGAFSYKIHTIFFSFLFFLKNFAFVSWLS